MVLIDKIKETIGRFILKSEMGSHYRIPKALNLQDAASVGILFDSSNAGDFEVVKKYVNYLKEMKKRVKAIGYFSDNLIPHSTYSKLEYDFFTKKELNWYARPEHAFINNFIHDEFDILIDLNIYDRFPLKYIAALSKAKFKVGRYSENEKKVFDMLIDCKETGVKPLLRDIDTYLLMINKKAQNLAENKLFV